MYVCMYVCIHSTVSRQALKGNGMGCGKRQRDMHVRDNPELGRMKMQDTTVQFPPLTSIQHQCPQS